jgi:hypothetical protein
MPEEVAARRLAGMAAGEMRAALLERGLVADEKALAVRAAQGRFSALRVFL